MQVLQSIYNVLWGAPMLILLVLTHLILTFRTRFIQASTLRAIKLYFGAG